MTAYEISNELRKFWQIIYKKGISRKLQFTIFIAGSEWWRCSRESKGWPERHVGNCSKTRRVLSREQCFSSAHRSWCTSWSLTCAGWSPSPSRTQLPFLRRRRDLLRRRRLRKPSTRRWYRGTLSRTEGSRGSEKQRRLRTSAGRRGLQRSRKSPPRRSLWRVLSLFSVHELWRKRKERDRGKVWLKEKLLIEMPLKDVCYYR